MLNNLTSLQLSSASPMFPRDIAKVSKSDLEKLDKEYKARSRKVEQLAVVPQAQTYKRELLKSIDGEYVHDKLSILAYLDPIQAMRQSPPMCKQYLEPFFKDQTAVQHKWQQMVEKRALSNSYAMSRYQEEKASNPAKYAKIDLITFGFSNCVNNQRYHADSEIVLRNQQKLNKTLFGKSLTMVCEEP